MSWTVLKQIKNERDSNLVNISKFSIPIEVHLLHQFLALGLHLHAAVQFEGVEVGQQGVSGGFGD